MTKKLGVLVALTVLLIGGGIFLGTSDFGSTALKIANGGPILPVVILSALVDSINPCAFSVLLLTIGFLFSLGKAEWIILRAGLFYIGGIFVTYVLIGLGLLKALSFFNVPHGMAKIGAAVLVLFGALDLLNEFFPSFPIKMKIPQSAHAKLARLIERASGPIALLLGIMVALYEFPCTGGPYLFVLGLLHDSTQVALGFSYLIFYNLIFVLPLVVILLIASDAKLLERVQGWKRSATGKLRFASGALMVAIGIFMFIFYG
ncbi:MAG: cytochrome c biogenesis protein CcdA [Patescibacteria group bacterium]